MKKCNKCNSIKSESEFRKVEKKSRDCFYFCCKSCEKVAARKYYLLNYSTEKRRLQFNKTKLKNKCQCGSNISPKSKRCKDCFFKLVRDRVIVMGRPFQRGSKHLFWNNGKTERLRDLVKGNKEYKDWRSKIFQRDKWTCTKCGICGGTLHAHHIVPFCSIIETNKISNLAEALLCQDLWDINNGITLCVRCHKSTDNYAGKGLLRKCYRVKVAK